MIHRAAEHVLEGGLAAGEFGADARVVGLGQARVADRMGADREAHGLDFPQLGGGHQGRGFGADAGIPARGGTDQPAHRIHRGRVAVGLEHRRGVVEKIHVGVVEGEHQRARRQRLVAPQPGRRLVETDDRVAEQAEHRHLGLEARQVAIQRAMRLDPPRELPDAVIHEDVHARHRWPPQASW